MIFQDAAHPELVEGWLPDLDAIRNWLSSAEALFTEQIMAQFLNNDPAIIIFKVIINF